MSTTIIQLEFMMKLFSAAHKYGRMRSNNNSPEKNCRIAMQIAKEAGLPTRIEPLTDPVTSAIGAVYLYEVGVPSVALTKITKQNVEAAWRYVQDHSPVSS